MRFNLVDKDIITIALSDCCNGKIGVIQPSLGDVMLIFCMECNTECIIKYKPKYTLISKGIYRPIIYQAKSK